MTWVGVLDGSETASCAQGWGPSSPSGFFLQVCWCWEGDGCPPPGLPAAPGPLSACTPCLFELQLLKAFCLLGTQGEAFVERL